MADLKQKHLDLLPEVLDFVTKPVPATPNLVDNLDGEILDVLHESALQPANDEIVSSISDDVPSLCRASRMYDYHGSRLGIKKSDSLTEEEYKIFIEAITTCLHKGATVPSIIEGLEKLFDDVTLVEMKDVSVLPEHRKLFRVQTPLISHKVGDGVVTALNILMTFLDKVKPVTTDYAVDNLFLEVVAPLTDELSVLLRLLPAGPYGLDPVLTNELVYVPDNYDTNKWYEDSVFQKNSFSNQISKKNNFDIVYQNLFEDRDFDEVTTQSQLMYGIGVWTIGSTFVVGYTP